MELYAYDKCLQINTMSFIFPKNNRALSKYPGEVIVLYNATLNDVFDNFLKEVFGIIEKINSSLFSAFLVSSLRSWYSIQIIVFGMLFFWQRSQ